MHALATDLSVPAAGRTLGLLELLMVNPRGLTPRECVDQLGISRSTLFELLQTLKILGYVEQSHSRGRYRPGPRLLAWRGAGTENPQELLTAFFQEAASSTLDETLALAIPNPPFILILAQVESSQRVRTAFESNQHLDPKNTAAGAILTPTPAEAVRSMGAHLKVGPDSMELAIPVCEDGHTPVAALLLSAPKYRHSIEEMLAFVDPLRQMAARLSYRLGAATYAPYQGPALSKIEPSTPLTSGQIKSFLRGPWVASLACIRPDATPHVVPVWHEFDEGEFIVAAWSGSKWADYLIENPRVSLTVDEPWPPHRRVIAHGYAKLLRESDIPQGLPSLLDRLTRRFLGQPLNPDLAARPWRAFRISVDHLQGWRGLEVEGA
jgi:DNA-binding IclR family transcriptional regulator/nitroimidazol reductase NimA-like FMN-containing flavoprotein (pyridoxamine 5'-phosphate oxidase superfamily)